MAISMPPCSIVAPRTLRQPGSTFLIVRQTWNRASHWVNEHEVQKCRRCSQTALMDGKVKPPTCFLKKFGNAAYCGLYYKTQRIFFLV